MAKIVPNEFSSLWIWEIAEDEATLSDGLDPEIISESGQFKALSRRLEWLSIRQILKIAAGHQHLSYASGGKPHIPGLHLSVSHCRGYSAVYIDTTGPVGLDLEPVSEKLLKIAERFLHPVEKERFGTSDLEKLTLLWSTKEALFKKFGGETTFFARTIEVVELNASNNQIKAMVRTSTFECEEILCWKKLEGTYVVYTHKP